MTTQHSESIEVADQVKARFCHYIDERTAIGVEKYGEPLRTFNGRDAVRDFTEELVDALQYQEQDRQQLIAENQELKERISKMMPHEFPRDAFALAVLQSMARILGFGQILSLEQMDDMVGKAYEFADTIADYHASKAL